VTPETAPQTMSGIALSTKDQTTAQTPSQTIRYVVPQVGVSVWLEVAQAVDLRHFITTYPEQVDDTNSSHCRPARVHPQSPASAVRAGSGAPVAAYSFCSSDTFFCPVLSRRHSIPRILDPSTPTFRPHILIRFETEKGAGFPGPTPPRGSHWGDYCTRRGSRSSTRGGSRSGTCGASRIGTGGGSCSGTRGGSRPLTRGQKPHARRIRPRPPVTQ